LKEIKAIIKIIFSTTLALLLGIFYVLYIFFFTLFGTAYNNLRFYYKIRKIGRPTKRLLKKRYQEKTSVTNTLKNIIKDWNIKESEILT